MYSSETWAIENRRRIQAIWKALKYGCAEVGQ